MSFLDEYRDKFEEEDAPFVHPPTYQFKAKDTEIYQIIAKELKSIEGIAKKDGSGHFIPKFEDTHITLRTTNYSSFQDIGGVGFSYQYLYSILDPERLTLSWKPVLYSYVGGIQANHERFGKVDLINQVTIPFTFEDLAALLISNGF